MTNVVKPIDLMIDSEWTFVHSSGKRTLYTYKSLIIAAGPNPKKGESGLDAMHSLLNPETGKCAQVTEKWLREGPVGGTHSHWLVGDHVAELAEAA